IENDELDSNEIKALLKKYTTPMVAANIDYLVLGCSHYPYLIPQLREMLPEHVSIIDSGQAVAKQAQNVLQQKKLLTDNKNQPTLQFFTNTSTTTLKSLLKKYSEKTIIKTMDF
ncbi:MAG TPA: glutamate racemase, partial [Flavobacteriaceae bacterium]|nr:glutamate racemase [Flavobacteriaceae bacterium]